MDGLPINNGGSFHGYVSHNQMEITTMGIPSGKRLHNYGKIHPFKWENPL